jgi:hypothetical protein
MCVLAYRLHRRTSEIITTMVLSLLVQAFVLAVSVTFERLEDRDQFIDLWRVHMAPHVQEHEPNCLSYELAVADTDPKQILVYER